MLDTTQKRVNPGLIESLKKEQYNRRYYTKFINRQTNAAAGRVRHQLFMAGKLESGEKGAGVKDPKGIANKVIQAVMYEYEFNEASQSILGGKEISLDKLQKMKARIKFPPECPQEIIDESRPHIIPIIKAVKPLDDIRTGIEKEMVALAKQLPVYHWVESVKGFGALGLAAIVGTVGDLSNYRNPDKLKKRLGLDVHNGRAFSTWRKKAGPKPEDGWLKAEDWENARYDPQALSVVHADLLDSMIKHQVFSKNNKNNTTGETLPLQVFGALYLKHKAHQQALHGSEFTPKVIDLRARRYMMQQVIIALWCKWNGREYKYVVDQTTV